MSGSPVYLDGRLAGALSLKLGIFTKDPIAGVTPIQDVMRLPAQSNSSAAYSPSTQAGEISAAVNDIAAPWRPGLLPSGSTLEPIQTPLVFSGFQTATLQQFAPQIQSYGFVAAQGGTATPRPEDARLAPGDMAGIVLVQGVASISSACTFPSLLADRAF